MENEKFIFDKPAKKHICMNCEAIVSKADEKCWFCGITLHFND